MITFSWAYARYTGLIGATAQLKVRAISGLPSHHYYCSFWLKLQLCYLFK